jgi:hypothetical protein
MPINNVEKPQCLINKKKRFRVRNLFYYEELSQVFPSCTLHLLKLHPKPSLNTRRAKDQTSRSKTPSAKKIEHHTLI